MSAVGPSRPAARPGLTDGGLRFNRERHHDLAVQALPDVRQEAAAVTVEPALRQLFGKRGQVFGGRLVDFEVHQLGGLGNQLGIGGRKSRSRCRRLGAASRMHDKVVVRTLSDTP